MTSYLRYLFSPNVNTTIKCEEISDCDKYYESLGLQIYNQNITIRLMVDVLKTNRKDSIKMLTDIYDQVQKNETNTITCNGNIDCFFRQQFNIVMKENEDTIEIRSKALNRSSIDFSVNVNKESFLNELKLMIDTITNR